MQGSGREGGPSSGSGNESEWRSFNDKFLGQVPYPSSHIVQGGHALQATLYKEGMPCKPVS